MELVEVCPGEIGVGGHLLLGGLRGQAGERGVHGRQPPVEVVHRLAELLQRVHVVLQGLPLARQSAHTTTEYQ